MATVLDRPSEGAGSDPTPTSSTGTNGKAAVPLLKRPQAMDGFWSWITTVDHKRIGILYGVTSMVFFLLGGGEALLIRLQLAQPNADVLSADVIHSFWPAKLAGKVDTVPGRTNYMKVSADEPGDYSGQCAEFCGLSHANMRLKVIAKTPDDFADWVANQERDSVAAPTTTSTTTTTAAPTTTTAAAAGATSTTTTTAPEGTPVGEDPELDAANGAALFVQKGCSGCHTIRGLEGANGRVGPNLTHLQSRSHFAGAIFDLNEANLRKWLRNPPGQKPMDPENGQGMPNLGLSEDEITQLIAYLETLK
jgi:cytochrome c oxidase subunit 2